MSEAPGGVSNPCALTSMMKSPKGDKVTWNSFGAKSYMLRFEGIFLSSLNNTNVISCRSAGHKSD